MLLSPLATKELTADQERKRGKGYEQRIREQDELKISLYSVTIFTFDGLLVDEYFDFTAGLLKNQVYRVAKLYYEAPLRLRVVSFRVYPLKPEILNPEP